MRDTPEALARGLAVGAFFGVSCFWGLQIALALLVSHLVRGNKVVAAAMTAVSNPLTSLPLYSFCYFVGHLVLGGQAAAPELAAVQELRGLLALGPRFFVTMLAGTTLVGTVTAIVVYCSAHRLLAALQAWNAGKPQEARIPAALAAAPALREPAEARVRRAVGPFSSRSAP